MVLIDWVPFVPPIAPFLFFSCILVDYCENAGGVSIVINVGMCVRLRACTRFFFLCLRVGVGFGVLQTDVHTKMYVIHVQR